MALDRHKLTDVSMRGFDVENLEVLDRQLREVLRHLDRSNYVAALATANAIQARTAALVAQCERRLARHREESKG